ncbi:hypothetical protein EVAR_48568_1 [Eumeta japonica]|uniref:Gustatory receptor n=1 Tax=Eumeta variegata TaxID=151549 RepID=A0A4C1XFJ4_EUMVA|nr:hypothetical protein EVAR_48568_1 [Eumeta japonica]
MNVKNAFPAPGRVRKMYCVTICGVISVTYFVLLNYHVNIYHHFTENIFILLCNTFFILLMPSIPGIVVEQTAGEVDKIKLLLLEYTVQNINDREKKEARLFLRYLHQRIFRVRVWRTFTIDVKLPIGLISLFTTYLIVLIQLSHLYD